MPLFRRSLAEDAIDRYNHTWAVMLLLVLSLVTWLLPLSPSLQPQFSVSEMAASAPKKPRYSAQCWCPQEFTDSYVAYTNSICAAALNQAFEGEDREGRASGATVYVGNTEDEIPVESRFEVFRPKKLQRKSEQDTEDEDFETRRVESDARYFISVKTPLMLFVFAMCLKLPHVIWTLLSGLVGVNIDAALETCRASQALDSSSKQRLKENLSSSISKPAKSGSPSASLLYLLLKLLMCVVVIAEFVVVHNELFPEMKNLEDDITGLQERNGNNSSISAMNPDTEYFEDNPLLCDMRVRVLQTVQTYTIQCTFTRAPAHHTSKLDPHQHGFSLGIYEALYTILMAFFIVLAIINVVNFFMWLLRLSLAPCRRCVSPSTQLPADAFLILFMARENAGPFVLNDLLEGMGKEGAGKGMEEEKLHE